jgi:hypothetical protein
VVFEPARPLARRGARPLHGPRRDAQADDTGSTATWGDHVADEDYAAAPAD